MAKKKENLSIEKLMEMMVTMRMEDQRKDIERKERREREKREEQKEEMINKRESG